MAQYEALRSFGGKVSASKGRTVEIKDKAVADDLLKAGYIKAVGGKTPAAEKPAEKPKAEPKKPAAEKPAEKPAEEPVETPAPEAPAEEPAAEQPEAEAEAPAETPAEAPAEEQKTQTVNREAKTGRLVSDEVAAANPDTTVTETVKK